MSRTLCWAVATGLIVGCSCKETRREPTPPERLTEVAPAVRAVPAARQDCSLEAGDQNQETWVDQTSVYQIYPAKFTPAGTLAGVTENVPYLRDLGVKTIWLMPIFKATSDHGYDAIDYRAIEPDYGTKADLEALVCEAHRAKIRVLLDLVLNHTSKQHPWFSGPPAQRRDDWYVWSSAPLNYGPPWPNGSGNTSPRDPQASLDRDHDRDTGNDDYFYCAFCGSDDGMPDLNWKAALAQREAGQPSPLFDEVRNIMAYWVNEAKVDGYRVDAARYLVENGPPPAGRDQPETHRVWQALRHDLNATAPDAVLVAEAPTESYAEMRAYYGSATTPEFHGAFHFKYQYVLMQTVKDEARPANFFPDLYEIQSHLPRNPTNQRRLAQDFLFLSNHDKFAGERVATQLGGFTPKIKLAASLMLLLSGNPVVYYGEELGAQNDPPTARDDDGALRGPMDWTRVEQQKAQPDSILNHYKALLRLRNHYPALAGGISFALRSKNGSGGAFDDPNASSTRIVLLREYHGEKILVAHNLASTAQDMYVDLAGTGLPSVPDRSVVGVLMGGGANEDVTDSNRSSYHVGTLQPYTTRVLYLGPYPVDKLPTPLYEATVGGWSAAWFRGTPNGWGTSAMTRNAAGLWETTADFADPSPRFKISRTQDWSEAYPAADYPIVSGPGKYRIVFDDGAKAIAVERVAGL